MCGLTAGLLIASAAIAATSATSSAVVQKKQSDRQRDFENDRQRKIDAKAAQENAFYRMEYYRDPMRTAEGANALKQIREYNQSLINQQNARNVITGGTHEQTIAMQGRAMNSYAGAVSQIRANAESARRAIGQNWMNSQNNQFERQMKADENINALRQQSMTNAINNINNFSTAAQSAISTAMTQGVTEGKSGGNYSTSNNVASLYGRNINATAQGRAMESLPANSLNMVDSDVNRRIKNYKPVLNIGGY